MGRVFAVRKVKGLPMFEQFSAMHPVLQALIGTGFTWFMTALGASVVFFRRDMGRKLLDWMLGFAAGVMIAASFWSLLARQLWDQATAELPALARGSSATKTRQAVPNPRISA
nr:hypothetical protein [Desulfuromonas sp. TF]